MHLKLGKKKPRIDKRTIKLAKILRVPLLPSLPTSYDVDQSCPATIPTPMFGNDRYGDCVIASRAHQTLRFECFEQKQVLPISDDDVLNEYWLEGQSRCCLIRLLDPKPDHGLVMLDSLNDWRQGWFIQCGSKTSGHTYNIYAYAAVNRFDQNEVKYAVYLLEGIYAGIQVPQSAVDQFNNGLIWSDVGDNYILGGHAINIHAFDSGGLTCVTWGKHQKMTWQFWLRYADECYGIVDNRDNFLVDSPVDVEKLDQILREITS